MGQYDDSECNTVKSAVNPETLNAACTAVGNEWWTGSVWSSSMTTYQGSGPYTDSACTTLVSGVYGSTYGPANTCLQTGASTSYKYICDVGGIRARRYTDNVCTGGDSDDYFWRPDVVCIADTGNPPRYYKAECFGPGSGSASGGGHLCSHGLTQLFLAATA